MKTFIVSLLSKSQVLEVGTLCKSWIWNLNRNDRTDIVFIFFLATKTGTDILELMFSRGVRKSYFRMCPSLKCIIVINRVQGMSHKYCCIVLKTGTKTRTEIYRVLRTGTAIKSQKFQSPRSTLYNNC